MFTKAQEIGIPASFVELRHEITHAELPSLVVLRRAVQRSMTWLWDDFWKFQEVSSGHFDRDILEAFDGGSKAFESEIRQLLQSFLQDHTRNRSAPEYCDHQLHSVQQTALALTDLCQGSKSMLENLSRVLLDEHFLFPDSTT